MRSSVLLLGWLLATACGAPSDATAPGGPTASPVGAADAFDVLLADEVAGAAPITVQFGSDALAPTRVAGDPRLRVGASETLGLPIRFGEADRAALPADGRVELAHGAAEIGARGFVWTGEVRAVGARAVRLHLTDAYLPRHAELWVYDAFGEAHGPFVGRGPRGDGEVWTPTLRGDTVWLQVRYVGDDVDRVLGAAGFTLMEVGGIGDGLPLAVPPEARAEAGLCDQNATCVETADGAAIPATVLPARDAVALMLYQSRKSWYICSGGLIADDAGTGTPYFLTANHCISRSREASSLETFFQYATDSGDTCDFPTSAHTPRTVGAAILSTDRASDYTLLLLDSHPGGTTTELPYSTSDVAFADGTALYRISHPQGSPQAWSEHVVDTSYGTCSTWPRGAWIYSADVVGATQGGSSGSPVLNAAGEVVGQLSGGCGTNIADDCDAVQNATVDGNLAAYASAVAPWLGATAPPPCEPSPEDCSNGVDDDCDALVDGADPDCDPGGPGPGTCDLGLPGDSCADNAECCSANCKGKPGSRTCK